MKQLKNSLFISIGALILLAAAFVNGFPLLYSDTSTYLAAGFELETPFDRPIAYGLFMRFCSLNGYSLWLVIAVQAWLIAYLLFSFIQVLFLSWQRSNRVKLFFFSLTFLSLLTSLSWVSSELIADIMTPIMVLSVLLLILGQPSTLQKLTLYAIFFLATACHISHLTFNLVFFSGLLLVYYLNIFDSRKHLDLKPLWVSSFLVFVSFWTMSSAISKSKHAFFMGALVEHGIAKTYLDEYCSQKNYQLCAYKDSLPSKGIDFLWNKQSPFYKMGAWANTKEEFNEIIFNTLTTPSYILLHIKASITATISQLTKFKVGDGNGVFTEQTPLYQRMDQYIRAEELKQYNHSLQRQQQLSFLASYNNLLMWIMGLTFLTTLLIWAKQDQYPSLIKLFFMLLLLALFINAWSCGTFANAIDRLGAKMMWLWVLGVLFCLCSNRSWFS